MTALFIMMGHRRGQTKGEGSFLNTAIISNNCIEEERKRVQL